MSHPQFLLAPLPCCTITLMEENNTPYQQPTAEPPQPGAIIAPPNSQVNETSAPVAAPTAVAPAQPVTPLEPVAPVAPQPPAPVFEAETPQAAPSSAAPASTIAWTASEYIAHHKSPGWYVTLGVSALIGTFLVWLLTKDKISASVVLFGAIVFGVYAGRQPRQLEYCLDESGLTIGSKFYAYDTFRSFSVVAEGAFSSIVFMPLKRFATAVSIYYAPQDEAAIVELLAVRLPSEDRGKDPIDRLMSRVRF